MEKIKLDKHLQELLTRKPTTKARTRVQELVEKYLPYLNWNNQTLEEDMNLIFITANRAYKRLTEANFIERWEWIRDKNLYPLQAVKTLNK